MKNKYNPQNTIVAFIDILGFKEIVKNSEHTKIKNIMDVMNLSLDKLRINLNSSKHNFSVTMKPYENLNVTCFSDSIVISIPPSSTNLLLLISFIGEIQYLLLRKGILIRGGISHGEYYFDNIFNIGTALISAYELETQSKYPRVILSNTTFEEYGNDIKESIYYNLDSNLKKDSIDNFYYVDYLSFCDNKGLSLAKETIIKGLKNTNDNIKEKYVWLKEYYNNYVTECCKYNKVKEEDIYLYLIN